MPAVKIALEKLLHITFHECKLEPLEIVKLQIYM